MINHGIGAADDTLEPGLRRTRVGETGEPVYGPYTMRTHGVYRGDFRIALANGASPGPVHCATVQITDHFGRTKLAERPIIASELSGELKTFRLLASLRRIHTLELRIQITGAVELILDPFPALVRVSAILDERPRPELGHLAEDGEAFGRDTRRILRRLTPRRLRDVGLVSLGNPGDGGYVGPDDFAGIDVALSFGINDDISWDRDAADRGVTVYQFDHTVADPAPDDARMVFEPMRIAERSGPDTRSLSDLIRRHDRGEARPNIVLKMDIEGGEWVVLDHTPVEELARLGWIVCELHYFQGLAQGFHRALVDRCLEKLDRVFSPVHVHSNVWGGYSSFANTVVPNVLEVTFANEAIYRFDDGVRLFPDRLDRSCDPRQPDFYLGSFQF